MDDGTILLGKPNGMRSLWESGSHIGGPVFFWWKKYCTQTCQIKVRVKPKIRMRLWKCSSSELRRYMEIHNHSIP